MHGSLFNESKRQALEHQELLSQPMVHTLGMAFVLLWHVEEKGHEKQAPGSHHTRNVHEQVNFCLVQEQELSTCTHRLCGRDDLTAKAGRDNPGSEIPAEVGYCLLPHRVQQLSRKYTHEVLRAQGLGCQCMTNPNSLWGMTLGNGIEDWWKMTVRLLPVSLSIRRNNQQQ